jgi:hypothetical protein
MSHGMELNTNQIKRLWGLAGFEKQGPGVTVLPKKHFAGGLTWSPLCVGAADALHYTFFRRAMNL